jgi:hypothetical protein
MTKIFSGKCDQTKRKDLKIWYWGFSYNDLKRSPHRGAHGWFDNFIYLCIYLSLFIYLY